MRGYGGGNDPDCIVYYYQYILGGGVSCMWQIYTTGHSRDTGVADAAAVSKLISDWLMTTRPQLAGSSAQIAGDAEAEDFFEHVNLYT